MRGMKYFWENQEANFGKPLARQVRGGAHITFEILLKWKGKYIALRRPSIPGHESPPHAAKNSRGLLYFCHHLIRYGESVPKCIQRIVKAQAGVGVKSYTIVDIDSSFQKKDDQWAFTPHVIAELRAKPRVGTYGNRITEVVAFTKASIPHDFAWWSKKDLAEFLKEVD